MRYLSVLLLLFVITACTTDSTPDATATRMTDPVASVDSSQVDNAETAIPLTLTPAPLMNPQEAVQCPDAPDIRLIIQERGPVTDNNDETLNLRSGPGTSFEILVALEPLVEFTVIEGPTCAEDFSWFRVRAGRTIGWIAEGDLEDYYVEPHLSG